MPTTVVAAASFDDMIALTGYTIFINVAVQVCRLHSCVHACVDAVWSVVLCWASQCRVANTYRVATSCRLLRGFCFCVILSLLCAALTWLQSRDAMDQIMSACGLVGIREQGLAHRTRPALSGVRRRTRARGRRLLQLHQVVEHPLQAILHLGRVRYAADACGCCCLALISSV